MTAPAYYGATDGAKLLGVSRVRFYQLRDSDPTFPAGERIGGRTMWDGPALRAYKTDRRDGRARTARTRGTVLQQYRRHGNVSRAARSAGVDPATARRWLRELAVPLPTEKE